MKYKTLLIITMVIHLLNNHLFAQLYDSSRVIDVVVEEQNISIDDNHVYDMVEKMPEFPEGNNGLLKHINKNLKYPPLAVENNIQGIVYVSFIVEKDGKISDIKVLRSINDDLSAEAIRVISKLPKWIPGEMNGKTVRVRYNLPIRFKLS